MLFLLNLGSFPDGECVDMVDGEGFGIDVEETKNNMFSGEDEARFDSVEQQSEKDMNNHFIESNPALLDGDLDGEENDKVVRVTKSSLSNISFIGSLCLF